MAMAANAEQVVELDRPKRAARRQGAKSDPLDAIRPQLRRHEILGGLIHEYERAA